MGHRLLTVGVRRYTSGIGRQDASPKWQHAAQTDEASLAQAAAHQPHKAGNGHAK